MKTFLTLLGLSLSLTLIVAQTDVDLSIAASVTVPYNPMNSQLTVQVCVTNESMFNNLSSSQTDVNDVEVALYPSSSPNVSSFESVMSFSTNDMNLSSTTLPPSVIVDDVVIITNSNANVGSGATKNNSANNCEEVLVQQNTANVSIYTLASVAAGSSACFDVIIEIDNRFIGCGLALVAEIYAAKVGTAFITDPDSPYDVDPNCTGCAYPDLDDNGDGMLDTDDNITAATFDVCQFPDQPRIGGFNDCLYIPPGTWNVTLSNDPLTTYDVAGPQNYRADEASNNMPVTVTINNSLGCFSTFTFDNSVSTSLECFSFNPILPIELTTFTGKVIDDHIQLHWRTETEQNNAHMIVERSADGEKFINIGRVKGASTTIEPQEYTFVDEHPNFGSNYYRLRQVDTDGTEHLHEVIQVQLSAKTQQLKVVPTLVNETTNLQMAKPLAQAGQVVILTLTGKIIWTGILPEQAQQLDISTTHLPAGTYFVQVRGQHIHTARFVKE